VARFYGLIDNSQPLGKCGKLPGINPPRSGLLEQADEPECSKQRAASGSSTLRTWEHVHGFSDSSRYAIAIDAAPTITIWQRLLAHTIYNPTVPVSAEWRAIGERKTSDILALVEQGLQSDDDIIQQWFDASEVMRLLKAAETWEQLLIAVNCVGGGHEADDDARQFVRAVLPNHA
jgi:hypothetical protein